MPTAADSVMKAMALDLRRRGELDVTTSVTGVRFVIAGLTAADSGRFLQRDGRELPW